MDEELSKNISKAYIEAPILLWQTKPISSMHSIEGSDLKEILNGVLSHLPNPDQLTDGDFRVINR